MIFGFSTDGIAKRRGKAADVLGAEARRWEGAALKIERKGAALLRGSTVPGEEAVRGPGLLLSFLYRRNMPAFGSESGGQRLLAGRVGSVPGCLRGVPVSLRPSSPLFRKNTKDLAVRMGSQAEGRDRP